VARFLAILELYRQSAITFQQLEPLGELTLQWVAHDFGEEQLANLGDEWGGENTAHE
jgi:segregation and condensation protein A